MFIGRTDAEAEAPILWPPDVKNWLIGKDPDAGKDWRQKEKGTTEDEMVGCHHRLSGHEFERMASPTQWTWVWVNSRSWWWTGRPGILQSMGLQRVGHDWVTELNWNISIYFYIEKWTFNFSKIKLFYNDQFLKSIYHDKPIKRWEKEVKFKPLILASGKCVLAKIINP